PGNAFFEVRSHNKPCPFLINPRNAIVKRSRDKTAGAAISHKGCQFSKLLQLWASREKIVLNPNVERFFSRRLDGFVRHSQRVFNKPNIRFALLTVRILCYLLLEKLAEAS